MAGKVHPKFFPKILLLLLPTLILWGCQGLPAAKPSASGAGVFHRVQPGQTLYSIAKAYGLRVQTLIRINKIRDPLNVFVGRRLWIPGAHRVLYVPPTDKAYVTVPKKKKRSVRRPRVKNFLQWPVRGTVTSTFGRRNGRHHEGIDIAAPRGTPIVAAAAGKVVFSDWGPTGYGLMVIIKHQKHLTTVYAHNSKNWVRKNSWVKKGQKIASIGSTGRSTGPHLHFEVRNDAHSRNPLKYLSARR